MPTLALLASSCVGNPHVAPNEPPCNVSLDEFNTAAATEGQVTAGMGARRVGIEPAVAFRDESAILIGYCVPPGSTMASPDVASKFGTTVSMGGVLIQTNKGDWAHLALYPSIHGHEFDIIFDQIQLGTVRFDDAHQTECDLKTAPPFAVRACGMIVVTDWKTSIPLTSRSAGPADVDVREHVNGQSMSLGYFPLAVLDGEGGLVLRFGFFPPDGDRVVVRVNEIFRRRGTRDISFPLNPSLRKAEVLQLSEASV